MSPTSLYYFYSLNQIGKNVYPNAQTATAVCNFKVSAKVVQKKQNNIKKTPTEIPLLTPSSILSHWRTFKIGQHFLLLAQSASFQVLLNLLNKLYSLVKPFLVFYTPTMWLCKTCKFRSLENIMAQSAEMLTHPINIATIFTSCSGPGMSKITPYTSLDTSSTSNFLSLIPQVP